MAGTHKFAQVVQKFEPHSKLRRAWGLQGGVSAQVTALEIEQPGGQTKTMLLRQHGEVDRAHNPHIAADEFKLLALLQSAGIAAPRPYYLDQSCEILSTPYLVIEYIEGEPAFTLPDKTDLPLQLATQLSSIHRIDCATLDVSFLPTQEALTEKLLGKQPAKLDDSLDEGHIRDVLEAYWPWSQYNTSTLLHGDFWPGNILWREGQVAAVIDWEDARLGDPLADVANTRLELLWTFGSDTMHSFTHHYQTLTAINTTNLPYWDLYAALKPASKIAEWAGNPATEQAMRVGHKLFITQAFAKLPTH